MQGAVDNFVDNRVGGRSRYALACGLVAGRHLAEINIPLIFNHLLLKFALCDWEPFENPRPFSLGAVLCISQGQRTAFSKI